MASATNLEDMVSLESPSKKSTKVTCKTPLKIKNNLKK